MQRYYSLQRILLVLALAVPVTASAAARNFLELSQVIVTILNTASTVAIAAAIAVYFYAIVLDFKNITSGESDSRRKILFWGVIGLFVMVSIWGILRLLQNTFASIGN